MDSENASGRFEEALQSSPEKTNFMKLRRLLICGGTHAFKELFDSVIPPNDLPNKLGDPTVLRTLERLKSRRILKDDQWDVLFPPSGTVVESKSFDISLLCILLREICGITFPVTGLKKNPDRADTSLCADLARIKYYRNTIYALTNRMEVSKEDFQTYWNDIKDALVGIFRASNSTSIGHFKAAIDNCLSAPLTDNHEEDLKKLKFWVLEEEVSRNTSRSEEFDHNLRELHNRRRWSDIRIDWINPEITIKTFIKLVYRGTWLFGSLYILNRYKKDPDTFLKMVTKFVIPAGTFIHSITEGCLKLKIKVENLAGLNEIWSRYQSGKLREDLEKVLITEELKKEAEGDVVELEVILSEEEYKRACERLKALHHSDEASHDDSDPRHDKDDPRKANEVSPEEDLDETLYSEPKSPRINIIHGKQFSDGENTFQVHLAFITSQDEADWAFENLEKYSKIAKPNCKIRACRIFNKEKKSFNENCDDYGDLRAGARLLRLLEMTDARNVVVILTCWNKGTLLQPVGCLISKPTLELLRSAKKFDIKIPFKEEEVEEYFAFIEQHIPHNPTNQTKSEAPKVQIFHGESIKDKQSTFQAHLALITHKDRVQHVLSQLKKDPKVADATYNVYAYRLYEDDSGNKKLFIEECDDDDEYFAGKSLLHLLQILDVKNVMVIVTRWHGRIPLGHARFKDINQSALELLQSVGLVEMKTADEQKKLFKEQEEYLEHLKHCDTRTSQEHLPLHFNNINIIHGEKIEDCKSAFQAHLAVITSRGQVDQVLKELKKDQVIANANYNVLAYRVCEAERSFQDCDDSGEYLAGGSLLHLLEMTNAMNVVVIVTRWHGGIKLGRDRFKDIHLCALNLLQSEGIVERLNLDQEQEILAKLNEYFEYAKTYAADYYTEIAKSSCPKIIHGACFTDRKSTFQAHLAVVTTRKEVQQVLAEVKKDRIVARAKYNILAYRIFDQEKDTYIQDFDDDGEVGAGKKLLLLLEKNEVKNIVAVVTRWHGDILLGSVRFQHFNKCAVDLLKYFNLSTT